MEIDRYITEDARIFMRQSIAEAHGNEVFFVGRIDERKIVDRAAVMARGNKVQVPAIVKNCRPGEVLIHNHPSGALTPSDADLHIAGMMGNEGVGFYIIDNDVTDIYVAVEATVFEEPQPVEIDYLADFLAEHGRLAKRLKNFEFRDPQLRMLQVVAEAFNQERVAIIEAGTGTGKTLAYLLPAFEWSAKNGKRVLISTNTINLQQQLTEKDIPLLRSIYPKPVRAELIKGRTNYVCLRKLRDVTRQPDLLDIDGAESELEKLWQWAQKTRDGSKSDLAVPPSDKIWELVQSESDTTLKNRCEYYDRCFFYAARRRAATADILVANHHLLFADLAVRSASGNASELAVLPKYDRLILDEAHNLEDVASRYFGVSVSYLGILRILNRIYRIKEGKSIGHLPFALARVRKNLRRIPGAVADELVDLIEARGQAQVELVRAVLRELMERILDWSASREKYPGEEFKIRLKHDAREDAVWREILTTVPMLLDNMAKLCDILLKITKTLAKVLSSFEAEALSLSIDLRAQAERLTKAANELKMVLLESDRVNIRWIEARQGRLGPLVRLCMSPLKVAPIMQEAVFDRFPTVILTSATLSVDNSFAFLEERLGLDAIDEDKRVEVLLPSPFDFRQQAIIAIPTEIPEPNQPQYLLKLPGILLTAIRASRGRAFVLFTAYSLLNKMYDELEPQLQREGITVFRQGEASRHVLLNRFRTNVASVLFGTDSFWEGVDVQGQSLIHVIIPRLPFKVPSEPIIEARVEAMEREGRNSFMEYTVPQAVIKFRQGFGRLIRTRQDFGAISILDRRVVSKQYGRVFLSSLPDCEVVVGEGDTIFAAVSRFLGERLGEA